MTHQWKFTIRGNQEDITGNPIPYHRATQRSYWNAANRRYHAWKDYVRATAAEEGVPTRLPPFRCGRVEAVIHFKNESHADPDNIVKGILDALFKNDKHIDVTTHHNCRTSLPRVEVTLTLQPHR